uniref:Uncharacterized protein n=1 Tax=Anguilla anguilla TaxID=7936 RepID=A0A0E9UPL1_ANGAN
MEIGTKRRCKYRNVFHIYTSLAGVSWALDVCITRKAGWGGAFRYFCSVVNVSVSYSIKR